MGELARRRASKLDKLTATEVAAKNREARIAQAEVKISEDLAAYEVQLRLGNGHELANQAKSHITALHIETMRAGRLGAELQAEHREIDVTFTLSAAQLIHGYMDRKRRYG